MTESRRALLVDADGVVIETWGFAKLLQREYSISRNMTSAFFGGVFQSCLRGESELADVLGPFLRNWQWPSSCTEFIRLWMDADDQASPAALKAIETVRRPQDMVCLASNQERTRARYISQQMGFSAFFDRLYFSCDLGAVKPEARFFQAIQADLGLPPEQILFWDDSRRNVLAARQLGWKAHVYEGPQSIIAAV